MRKIKSVVEAFFSRYQPTLEMLEQFFAEQKNHQEFVLLSCARLDSLANLAFTEGTQKSRFARFLARHSALGKRAFAVSVPDLYYHFQHYLWIRRGNIPFEGRIILYRERDKEFAQFIYDSGIPITETHVGHLLEKLMGRLKDEFRITPAQEAAMPTTAPVQRVVELISDAVRSYAREYGESDLQTVNSIVSAYTLGALLYRRYRSTAIHEWGVDTDEAQFFTNDEIYWRTAPVHSHRFLKAQFPALVLLNALRDSIESYKRELVSTRKLPFALWAGSRLDESFLDSRHGAKDLPVKLLVR